MQSRGGCSCFALGQKQVKAKRGRKNKNLRVLLLTNQIPATPQHLAARSAPQAGPREEAQHRVHLAAHHPPTAPPWAGPPWARDTQTGREEKGGRKEISELASRVLWPLRPKSFIATGWCFGDSTWLMIVLRKATFPAGYRHHVHPKPSTAGKPKSFFLATLL